jgi:hypothetical protein
MGNLDQGYPIYQTDSREKRFSTKREFILAFEPPDFHNFCLSFFVLREDDSLFFHDERYSGVSMCSFAVLAKQKIKGAG